MTAVGVIIFYSRYVNTVEWECLFCTFNFYGSRQTPVSQHGVILGCSPWYLPCTRTDNAGLTPGWCLLHTTHWSRPGAWGPPLQERKTDTEQENTIIRSELINEINSALLSGMDAPGFIFIITMWNGKLKKIKKIKMEKRLAAWDIRSIVFAAFLQWLH